jgi:hypothetical protein
MPSSYTTEIAKDISFPDFVMRCSRAFGAMIMMRDEPFDAPIPERFEPSDYHTKKIAESIANIVLLEGMSDAEAEVEAEKSYREAVERNNQGIAEVDELRKKYEAMLDNVNSWTPPTKDHEGLKKFMIEQITLSIQFDCNASFYENNQPKKFTGEEWRQLELREANKTLAYHKEENQKEIERTESRNEWLKQLRDSLQV